MNKAINGSQCTILWHVDVINSHNDEGLAVSDVLNKINKKYGVKTLLVATCGNVSDYLGITIDFTTPDKVKFTMHDYISSILVEPSKNIVNKGRSHHF